LINIPRTTLFGGLERVAQNRHNPCDAEFAGAHDVPKRDSSAGFRLMMLSNGRPEQAADDGTLPEPPRACVALVPSAPWSQAPSRPLSRPSSIFVTHLIATAEQAPQTRSLRRATAADAQTAYGASQSPVGHCGLRTRQII
jgi:hypothetical protein